MSKQTIYINSIASTLPDTQDSPEFVPGKQVSIQEPDYKTLIPDATLRRRMSRIVRMGVATGMQCLNKFPNAPVDAILTATGYGCLGDTEKFMNTLLDNHEQMLTPTAFIQSTFNTIGAQIALLSKNHGYNNTYTHRAFSFESALLDAILLLREEEASNVLVGAIDEMTPTVYEILKRLGLWRNALAGEGANFAILSTTAIPESYAVLEGIELFNGTYSAAEIQERIHNYLVQKGEKNATVLFPDAYKNTCGEYPTAIAYAFNTCCKQLQSGEIKMPILVYNTFLGNHSFIFLKPV
ncbi:beta-ketoacyl synthase chain length factor [Butyricimonas paravirosa]|uniref:beta-ketoacyl synthase chain length factor n=1 Tax=Butyricimonas paravirosa TaxID=1472417 RepID=UPI00210ADD22|nr:beta-ketoacyl synthase chain length factor [Butyricimonas paravirosa]MCQ4872239.1 beta-ketoacyl synthase chain length factor [Butyricimonas paravirosa]